MHQGKRFFRHHNRSLSPAQEEDVSSNTTRGSVNNSSNNHPSSSPSDNHASSEFDVSRMEAQVIRRRVLYPYSVHYSLPTSKYIATITRHCDPTTNNNNSSNDKSTKYVQFSFASEREAQKFCKTYCPPKMMEATNNCQRCLKEFGAPVSSSSSSSNLDGSGHHNHHKKLKVTTPAFCRNCGMCVCDACSVRWSIRMIPKTYYLTSYNPKTMRVCKSCDWLSNAFCMALLQGRYNDALRIHDSGNVNLRSCFANIHNEAMFPIHCAVMGGSLDLVRWLADIQRCPISVKCHPRTGAPLSVETSESRTLIELAMTGRPKLDILKYLIQKGLSVLDVKDPTLAPKTLEALLKTGFVPGKALDIGITSISEDDIDVVASEESVTTIEDACTLCYERTMDCVLTPCGHQVCCSQCGKNLNICPICKAKCSVLRIFRP